MSETGTAANSYAQSLLGSIGMPITPENVTSVLAYLQCGGNPSNLSADRNSAVRLALEHNSPRPVFGHAIGGSIGDCIANTPAIDLASFHLPGGGTLPSPGDITGGLKGVGDLASALTSPTLWIRVGEFLLAGVFLVLGVYLMSSESQAMTHLKSQAESAAVVAAAA